MKFTLSWLKDHLVTKASLDEILAVMLKAGLEVEHVEDPNEKLSAFTVCKVKSAEPHPDADKLRVCTVDTVDGEKTIVCGAPNARAGMSAIYAPLGTYIPGLDFALDKKPRKIRGVESHGMMCSSKELEAGDDHDQDCPPHAGDNERQHSNAAVDDDLYCRARKLAEDGGDGVEEDDLGQHCSQK